MAIVQNSADNSVAADGSFETPNRVASGSPVGSVTPEYAGERYQDSDTGIVYEALSPLSDSWAKISG